MMVTSPIDEDRIQAERDMLLRFCTRYTRDPHAAEDLAQQTLMRAWRVEDSLRDPQARRGWLIAIARNVCRAWAHERTREPVQAYAGADEPLEERVADDVDIEVELEREELAELLDRALALLTRETRQVLIQRYIEERPQAEIAARLHLTEGAVEARLHRGKLGLRRLLTTTLGDEAVSLDVIPAAEAGWEATRLWCPGCGRRRVEGRFRPETGELDVRCPACSPPGSHYIGAQMGSELRDLRTYRPAISRVLESIHQMFQVRVADGHVQCPGCREWLSVRRERADVSWLGSGVVDTLRLECERCRWRNVESWHSLTWSLPEGRSFWRANPRMRFLLPRDIVLDGVPAVLAGFESVTGAARLQAVFLRDTGRVARVVEG